MWPLDALSGKVDNMGGFLVSALNAVSDKLHNMDQSLVSIC